MIRDDRLQQAPPTPDHRDERIRELEEQLEQARAAEARMLREFRNYRRHAEADLAQAERKTRAELLGGLGSVVQALEHAGAAAQTDPAAVKEGIVLVARGLRQLFQRHGLSRIPTRGEPFDPTIHEAVLAERVDGFGRGTVVREIAPGFRTDDQVIRPAKVSVAA